jgi:hypothetical protein
MQVVPEAELDYLTLSRLHVGQDGADQRLQFGLPQEAVNVGQAVCLVGQLADDLERHRRIAQLAYRAELHRRIG